MRKTLLGAVCFSWVLLSCKSREFNSDANRDRDSVVAENLEDEDWQGEDNPMPPPKEPRGKVWDYDAGPSKESKWPELFASTPNYRAIGKKILGGSGEKFRWHFGPMYYRGRLTPQSVKVFVVGQEGAQDESLSNRSFTGGTGGKMQKVLNYLGIESSYLFMNTFVYTIHGQYTENGKLTKQMWWLAQNPQSPIVQHRHKLFDYMLETNDDTLSLVIGVGTAGKHSVQTWAKSLLQKGGNISGECNKLRDTSFTFQNGRVKDAVISGHCQIKIKNRTIRFVGVSHPGAAGKDPNAILKLEKEYPAIMKDIGEMMKAEPQWLRPDKGGKLRAESYRYASHSIPYRDFAFSTSWRLGRGGTSSNRQPDQQAIQLFSSNGKYRAEGATLKYDFEKTEDLKECSAIDDVPSTDLPWEAPRKEPYKYDEGPGKMAELLMSDWPDFEKLGVTSHSSLGYNGIYRGRLESAELLVIADQESNDDLFSTRALTGAMGQRLQTYIREAEVGMNYAILRTLPVDTLDLPSQKVVEIATDPKVVKVRNKILKEILSERKTKQIVTVGPAARAALAAYESLPSSVKVTNLLFEELPAKRTAIPREDLPFQTKWWVGSCGERARRAKSGSSYSGDYYKFYLPTWIHRDFENKVPPLTSSESDAISNFR